MKLLAAPGAVTGHLVPCILRDSTALRPRRALAFPNSMTLASISTSPRPWASPWMPVALASTAPTSPSCAISSAPLARSSLDGRLSIQHTSVRQIWRRSARLAATNRISSAFYRFSTRPSVMAALLHYSHQASSELQMRFKLSFIALAFFAAANFLPSTQA
jgi:hypothetical protein